ncbi:MAG: hypothetical protein V3V08_06510 [Nannocystaceae bacterium]
MTKNICMAALALFTVSCISSAEDSQELERARVRSSEGDARIRSATVSRSDRRIPKQSVSTGRTVTKGPKDEIRKAQTKLAKLRHKLEKTHPAPEILDALDEHATNLKQKKEQAVERDE